MPENAFWGKKKVEEEETEGEERCSGLCMPGLITRLPKTAPRPFIAPQQQSDKSWHWVIHPGEGHFSLPQQSAMLVLQKPEMGRRRVMQREQLCATCAVLPLIIGKSAGLQVDF